MHRVHFDLSIFPETTAAAGQLALHLPQPIQFLSSKATSYAGDWDSGFAHQWQESGQPLKKKTVLMPGPSKSEYLWMLKSTAVFNVRQPAPTAPKIQSVL